MKTPELCEEDLRRQMVRDHRDPKGHADLNGIDFVEVSHDQLKVSIFFLGKAPKGITKNNFVITGGRRVTGINVIDLDVCRQEGKDLDDCLRITVDKRGDFSDYTLHIVETDKRGRPTKTPFHGFDPRFAEIDFSFKAGCQDDLDCLPRHVCAPKPLAEPEMNYLAKDFASFRQIILDRLSLIMPGWREEHLPDVGVMLVDVLAYVGDHLSYYQDAVATEAYLDTARQRISVRRHARLVDYQMHEGCNSRAWVFVETLGGSVTLKKDEVAFITGHNGALPEGERIVTAEGLRSIDLQPGLHELFEPMGEGEINLSDAHNEIRFYTWGDFECCLSKGATGATLVDEYLPGAPPPPHGGDDYTHQQGDREGQGQYDAEAKADRHDKHREPKRKLKLRAGDVLIFEEVVSPTTGEKSDVDPAHRHAVLLTKVTLGLDRLTDQPVVEIEWADEDALPFPLCLSATGDAPDCERLEPVTVARGNVVLVDYGRTIDGEEPGTVPTKEAQAECCDSSCAPEIPVAAGRFGPRLEEGPLTFSQPLPPLNSTASDDSEELCPREELSAARMLRQDARQALPQIRLESLLAGDSAVIEWEPRYDLLASLGDDNHYVVEVDNRARAHLRFGDGELGRAPEPGEHFRASYRVGNGVAGNVGAEAISHIVLKNRLSGITLRPRNPLPAGGGIEPESAAEVKMFAPYAFRSNLQRAVTAEDYATLAGRHPRVEKAAAILRWTGAVYEVIVAVDPKERAEADEKLLDEVECLLRPFRRIGHELKVEKAIYVPLDIEMTVCVKRGFLSGHIKAEMFDLFGNAALPGGGLGYFHPDRLTFGTSIKVSNLVALAQTVTGVENVVVTRLQRYRQPGARELAEGILKLGPMEVAQLDNNPNFPENGRIGFKMVGGI
jgi:hypothetical protein